MDNRVEMRAGVGRCQRETPVPASQTAAHALTRIFHQDAELWRRTGRDRLGSTGAANRSFYWQDGHARYGRPEPARIRGTPNPIWPQTKRPYIGRIDAPASDRGWPGEISGLSSR